MARSLYPDLQYFNLDDSELRDTLKGVRTAAWARNIGPSVLDEAQKEPTVFEKVKYAYDAGGLDFSVLLGSSRIMLLEQVRESLAGRAFLFDLWPTMLSEVALGAWDSSSDLEPRRPLFDQLLRVERSVHEVLGEQPEVFLGDEEHRRLDALEYLLEWGGMPGLFDLTDGDRKDWLRSYQQTYLERDLADLVRLRDLYPFRALQQLAMLRSGQVLSYSKLGRDAGVKASTTKEYLEYLDLTYQVIRLRPYYRNLTSSVVKTPKLYWADLGLLRQGTGQWGVTTGAMFENFVVAEAHKWIHTMAAEAQLYFYRTRSQREIDLLIETPAGLLGIEIKQRDQTVPSDARSMVALAEALADKPGLRWLGGLVVYRGKFARPLVEEHGIWSVPVHHLFS